MRNVLLPLGVALTILGSSCGLHTPQQCLADQERGNNPKAFENLLGSDFTRVWPNESDLGKVYCCNSPPKDGDNKGAFNRPVLVLHEYDHLSIHCLDFADRLSREGFTVYVPLLFGKADGRSGPAVTLGNTFELAASGQWHALLSEHKHQPITERLMKICRRISSAHDHRGIGVIGMCLTGALPIALMSDDCVVAPVVAQPSMPLFAFTPEGKRALGISHQELMTAVRRVQEKHLVVFGTRYEDDTIGTRERFDVIRKAFGDCFSDHTIGRDQYLSPGSSWGLKSTAHATLTLCYRDAPDDYPPRRLFVELVAFLKRRLSAP
jgi:dienelactone hydrolase